MMRSWKKNCLKFITHFDTVGIVVGAVFGSVAALAIAGILVWWTCRKKRRNRKGTEGKCCIHVMLSNDH